MQPSRVIDSHIHLWPHSAANPTGHSWMQPDGPLTRQFSIPDYVAANKADPVVEGFVYVETDRHLEQYDPKDSYFSWAEQTFEELRWLRRMVEGDPAPGEGFVESEGRMLKGAVIWAPVDRGFEVFKRYLDHAQVIAGDDTWKKVKGIRFLLQGITDERDFRKLVLSTSLHEIFEALPDIGEGMSFDIGVDTRSAGVWQLEIVTQAIRRLRNSESDHMCKPDYTATPSEASMSGSNFERWRRCMVELSKGDRIYIKLSGGFSEMESQDPSTPWPASKIVKVMGPWLDVLFSAFQPERIMFGSDWPVCNVGGPGDELSWSSWKAAVQEMLELYDLTERQKDQVWYRTAVEAYRL